MCRSGFFETRSPPWTQLKYAVRWKIILLRTLDILSLGAPDTVEYGELHDDPQLRHLMMNPDGSFRGLNVQGQPGRGHVSRRKIFS